MINNEVFVSQDDFEQAYISRASYDALRAELKEADRARQILLHDEGELLEQVAVLERDLATVTEDRNNLREGNAFLVRTIEKLLAEDRR